MKIVIAPDSFKESMSALEVATAMEKGIQKVVPDADIYKVPIADGGEGTVQALLDARGGRKVTTTITGPLGKPIESFYGILEEEMAVIEVAAACGLDLIPPDKRNPMYTTSVGVGELMNDALDKGIRSFIIGLGGSGTNDGGIGMAQALGVAITDVNGDVVAYGGNGLKTINSISIDNIDPRLAACDIKIATDVSNALLGKQGASSVYGPQKGADNDMVAQLDEAMAHYAAIMEESVGVNTVNREGAGAAGGLGAACIAFLDAEISPGIDLIVQLTRLTALIKSADFILTGEGKMDEQTSFGKAISGVAKLAADEKVPVIAITGANHTGEAMYEAGITAIFSLPDSPMTLEMALDQGAMLTERVTENVFRLIMSTHKKEK